MPNFKKDSRGFRMKGFSPFTQKKDDIVYEGGTLDEIELTPKTSSSPRRPGESISNWKKRTGLIPWEKGDTPYKQYDPVKEPVGPVPPQTRADYMSRQIFNLVERNKPKDDDSEEMTPKEATKHRARVLEYNRDVAKPLNTTQKNRIKKQLETMDPNDPEAKLLQDMLNLDKNK